MHDVPQDLLLVRHGESAGNVARDVALRSGAQAIDIAGRDCDVPLSKLGEEQSRALGRWLRENGRKPEAIFTSPYVRARQTAELLAQSAGWPLMPQQDERLREKEFGELDRLTRLGIEHRFPEQAAMRAALGKFYYRPPGGESWTDVALRLRSFYTDLRQAYAGRRVLIVSHQVVVLCFRYIIERLDESAILAIDAQGDVANCSITDYANGSLQGYNVVAPLREEATPVTVEPDAPVAPK